jgi:hypothetical protein
VSPIGSRPENACQREGRGFDPRLPLCKSKGYELNLVALRRSCTASCTAFEHDGEGEKEAIMIVGRTDADFFAIICEKCGSKTKNAYLGTDPVMPRFNATCPKCGDLGSFKLDALDWSGLHPKPHQSLA